MGKITLYRVTLGTDTSSTTDKIEFNDSSLKGKDTVYGIITSKKQTPTDGVGVNQGAEQELGDQQALGTVEDILVLTGYINKRNDNNGLNPLIARLVLWSEEEKEVDGVWDLGRMGTIDADDNTKNVAPVRVGDNQIAYLWEKIEWTTNQENFKANTEGFIITLRKNKGDDQ